MGIIERFAAWLRANHKLSPKQFLKLPDLKQLAITEEFRKWLMDTSRKSIRNDG